MSVPEGILNTLHEIGEGIRSGAIRVENRYYECSACFNSGFREATDPRGSAYRGVVRCDQCRYWEYRREKTSWVKA